jgi:hypothetical protein
LVLAAGVGLFAGILYKGLGGIGNKLQQVLAPGETDVTLDAPGNYTIFYESQSIMGGKLYSTDESISGLSCALVSKATNSKIAISASSMNTTYEFGGRSGRSVFEFTIDQPGIYAFTASYPQEKQGPEVVLAVGKDVTTGIFATVLGGLAVFFGSIGAALAILLVTLIKRSNKKKLLAGTSG